jgi:hypothetical protein
MKVKQQSKQSNQQSKQSKTINSSIKLTRSSSLTAVGLLAI